MPEWVEFHDSTLESVRVDTAGTSLQLNAYVHRWERTSDGWAGSGWSQPVTISICDPGQHAEIGAPTEITDGCLTVDGTAHRNWLSLPFIRDGQLTLWFEAMSTQERIQFSGRGVRVEAAGPARLVEVLSDDMRPEELVDFPSDSR